METITIIKYSTRTGKGIFARKDGTEEKFRYHQLLEGALKGGTKAYLTDNNMITPRPNWWTRFIEWCKGGE